jgi:Tfp pilus assembly protein PilX
MNYQLAQAHPRGMVLMFTLVIMLLMSLMGAAVMMNTRTELNISHNTYMGRDAFAKADATARIGVQLARALLYPGAGAPGDYVTTTGNGSLFTVEIEPGFTLSELQELGENESIEKIQERYLRAGAAETPHLTIKYGGQVVGTAAVSISSASSQAAGGSQGQHTYDGASGTTTKVYLIVSSDGRIPSKNSAGDAGKYYGGQSEATHSIVTTIFQEIMP